MGTMDDLEITANDEGEVVDLDLAFSQVCVKWKRLGRNAWCNKEHLQKVIREAEVMWNRLNMTTWIDLANIKNDLETAYAENYPIILQVAMFEAHASFVRQLRWRKGEEHTLVTCSPDGTIKIWTSPKQLRRAREWDQKHHPPLAEVNDDDKVVPSAPTSPSAAVSPSALALTDLGRPPALSALGELPALPPLPKLENAPSSSALRLAGSGN